ncbi:flagellin [Sphingomonas sp. C3-2]|uniref:flagellin n=1 Tax=Sphingomonas sp. C3-2 TaxID=3062169 RepID=UPI00294B374E|nr:flagellin [Sphingomonas sp. C3-2]WOK37754.1 flagellin [Sphingomonas sp. C3-2]
MNRVSTFQLTTAMSRGIERTQQNLANAQMQFNTGKKTQDYSGLGAEAIRSLSARSVLVRQQAYTSSAGAVTTTLELYDAHMSNVETSMGNLRQQIYDALALDSGLDLYPQVEGAFSDFRNALNNTENGKALFGGAQTGDPFLLNTLGETVGINPDDAFANDQIRNRARLGDGLDVEYGIVATDFGKNFVSAFGTLAALGPLDGALSDTDRATLKTALEQIDAGLSEVRAVNGENGRKLAYVDTLNTRAEDRIMLLETVVGKVEDADLGRVAIDITHYKTMLEASYSVFSTISGLSLTNYLR